MNAAISVVIRMILSALMLLGLCFIALLVLLSMSRELFGDESHWSAPPE
jgi:hypothetical protein